ncbi:hypothetical protein [Mucilaginibacter sp. PPCGB 2223]|uniref:hypothetical protein n=1 Tax=Mucilaginibacter sp. PPCGB 2223 TaxID=1886027 RepID=UPI000826E291|nr:hypothetical protein [Mucilaginibacter sp. PPCGB 2223]
MLEDKPKLFNRLTIFIFSILLSTFFGGILYSNNLSEIENRKQIVGVLIFCLIWNGVSFKFARQFSDNFFISFILPNAIGGLILIKPMWDYHFKNFKQFTTRKIWVPAIIALIIYGVLIGLNLFYVR